MQERYCIEKRLGGVALTVVLLIIVMMTIGPPAHAEGSFKGASVRITGKHLVTNATLHSGEHTFVLKGEEGTEPMPEGSDQGRKRVTVGSGEAFDFGEIRFDKQGFYYYRIEREVRKCKDLKQDDTVYIVKIAVFNDGETAVVYQKDGEKGKADKVIYEDKYVGDASPNGSRKGGKRVQTGDRDFSGLYTSSACAGAVLLISLLLRRKRDHS